MSRSRPTFEFCRTYDGSEPAARWLKRLEFDLRGLDRDDISPEQYLSSVDLLLMGEAADWAESSPEISTILTGSHTKESLQRFLTLFKERFPSKAVEVVVSFPEALETLRQNADESLSSYYQRTVQITSRYGIRDRLPGSLPLSTLESSALDIIYGAFLKGLVDRELRYKAIRGCAEGRSLYSAFMAIEEASKARVFIKKMEYEESQTREIVFYKDIAKRNVSASQLESILAEYKAGKAASEVPDQKIPQQFLLPSPESSQQPSRPAIKAKSVSWSVDPKSVSWSVDPPEVRRSILKPGSGYASGYNYGGYEAAESRGVVNAGSVVTSVGAGYGPGDQGVG